MPEQSTDLNDTSSNTTSSSSSTSVMNHHNMPEEMVHQGDMMDQHYFSNESLEDRNSTTSSTEGSINVERRKVRTKIRKTKLLSNSDTLELFTVE